MDPPRVLDENEPLVTGQIIIAAGVPALRGATVHVRLEDVSYADAPATLVAEVTISVLDHPAAGGTNADSSTIVPFAIRPTHRPTIDPGADYTLRAWVDAD